MAVHQTVKVHCLNLKTRMHQPVSHRARLLFFFLECSRCRAKARSLHEHKQETDLYKGKSSPMRRQIDYNWTQTKNTGQPNTTTRKSPSQTCVSPEETAKQTAKQQTKTKNGARAQTKTPTKSICHGTQWLVHCIIIKNVPMNRNHGFQANMKALACEFTLVYAKLYTHRARMQFPLERESLSLQTIKSRTHFPYDSLNSHAEDLCDLGQLIWREQRTLWTWTSWHTRLLLVRR